MLDILTNISEGKAEERDLEILEEIGNMVKETSLCALGGSAPNPVLSTLRYFRDEYEVHIKDKKCPAGVCLELIRYSIDEAKCTGCGVCKKECPQGAISGEKKEPHKIDKKICIKCGICLEVCKFDVIEVG